MQTKIFIPYTVALLVIFFLLPTLVHAQPGFGDDVDDVPIDGGLSLLLTAGISYGVRKIQRANKNNTNISK